MFLPWNRLHVFANHFVVSGFPLAQVRAYDGDIARKTDREQVRCLGINEQVAQKLHACTGPQRQDRARDILDILDMLDQLDRVRARTAERIFGERNTRSFPPDTIISAEWHIELETRAAELGYRTTKAVEIQKEFTNLVAANASA
jgi:hypothetical protein